MNNFSSRKIAVTGVSAQLPGGSIEDFWELVSEGKEAITEVPFERWDRQKYYDSDQSASGKTYSTKGAFLSNIGDFDAAFFGLENDKEVERMDPQQRLALQEAWRVIEDAGYSLESLQKKKVGVYVGARSGDYHDAFISDPESLEPSMLKGHDSSMLSARISHHFDFHGPNLTVNTACSSMGVALHLAGQALSLGEIDVALVGSVNVMSSAQRFLMHSRGRLLSRSGKCRPFDELADGIVLGEAVGFVLLRRLEEAKADRDRIYGAIVATGVSHDGYCEKGIASPNPEAQSNLIKQVWEKGKVAADSIGYFETHGTGTYKGDAHELNAIQKCLKCNLGDNTGARSKIPLGSVKANVGHSITAAVLPGLIKILLCFKHKKLPPVANFETANELADIEGSLLRVPTATESWVKSDSGPRTAALSAFSYTGTNFHMVLEEVTESESKVLKKEACAVLLSAKSGDALLNQARQLAGWIRCASDSLNLGDLAYTLAIGRTHFPFRKAFIVEDLDALVKVLGDFKDLAGDEEVELQTEAVKGFSGNLEQAVQVFQQGQMIDWSLYMPMGSRRIGLPTYPFEKTHYWMKGAGQLVTKAKDEQFCRVLADREEEGVVLFFSRRDDVYQDFVRQQRKLPANLQRKIFLVKMGDQAFGKLGDRIFQIDPSQSQHYRDLAMTLGQRGFKVERIVHLWNYHCENVNLTYHGNIDRCLFQLEKSLNTGVESMRRMLHALKVNQESYPVSALFLHHGNAEELQPQNQLTAGWIERIFAAESSVSFKSLQICKPNHSAKELVQIIIKESSHDTPKPTVDLYCELNSEIIHTRELTFESSDIQQSYAVRESGNYIIHIGKDRRGIPLAIEWAKRVHDTQTNLGKLLLIVDGSLQDDVRNVVNALELGQQVAIAKGPLVEHRDLVHLVDQASSVGINDIHGVIYTAIENDAVLSSEMREFFLLDELSKRTSLDFFHVLYLEVNEVVKGQPFGACAEWRNALVETGKRSGKTSRIACSISNNDAQARIDCNILLEKRFEFVNDSHFENDEGDGRQSEEVKANSNELEFVRILSEVLRVDPQSLDLSLSAADMGLDSMSISDLTDRVNFALPVRLSPSLFYRHSSVRDIVNALFVSDTTDKKLKPKAKEDNECSLLGLGLRRGQSQPLNVHDRNRLSGDIAIVGMSGRFPMAPNLNSYWENLVNERDCIEEIPACRWNWEEFHGEQGEEGKSYSRWGGFIDGIDLFEPDFFGISAREAELMDPQQRLVLQGAWQAIEDAGYAPSSLAGSETGVFVGVATSDYSTLVEVSGQGKQAHTPIGKFHSILANRVSYHLDLRGPSEPIDTACSSSLVAVHRAVQAIRTGQCSQALVGGVNALLDPALFVAFSDAGMLSPDGRCKTFDASANGYVRGEGFGMLYLKSKEQAIADGDSILAVIKGTAVNHGGHAKSLTAPNPDAQAKLISRAHDDACVDAETIAYIETHGTGTSLGDPIEVDGLRQAFFQHKGLGLAQARCGIGSVKTNIGHLEAAAGMAGLIKVVLSMRNKTLPGSLHFNSLNPYVELEESPFYVVNQTQAWDTIEGTDGKMIPRRAGVSSFGFGGANAHVVLEEAAVENEYSNIGSGENDQPELIVLSARKTESLKAQVRQLLGYIEQRQVEENTGGRFTLSNLAYTLQIGRDSMKVRLAIVTSSFDTLAERLSMYLEKPSSGDGIYLQTDQAGSVSEGLLSAFAEDEELREVVGKWIEAGKLSRLAEIWVQGGEIDWHQFRRQSSPLRLNLPGYCFDSKSYWVEDKQGCSNREVSKDVSRLGSLLTKSWEVRSLEDVDSPSLPEGKVLVLYGKETRGLAQRLEEKLSEAKLCDIDSTTNFLQEKNGEFVGYIDLVACEIGRERTREYTKWIELLKKLIENADSKGLMVLVVTRGLEAFQNDSINRAGVMQAALSRMLQSEYRLVSSRHLDLEPHSDEVTMVDRIITEYGAESELAEVCYRAGKRYGTFFAQSPLENKGAAFVFPEGRVLLVTGGTRGIGLCCAQHMVRNYGVRKLILLGREEVPRRHFWEEELARGGVIAEKIKAIQQFEQQGVEVRILSVSLSDVQALDRNLEDLKKAMGPLGGVLHCAGLVDQENSAFVRKGIDSIVRVLEPKVEGLDGLVACLQEEKLKFFVSFSSVSAIVPSLAVEQSDYSMANAYLDYAAYADSCSWPMISVQWPSWKEAGMGEVTSPAYKESGLLSISNKEGMIALDGILSNLSSQVVMPTVVDPKIWQPCRLRRLLQHKQNSSASVVPLHTTRAGSVSYVDEKTDVKEVQLEAFLCELLARELRVDKGDVQVDASFQDYILDSILLAQIIRRISIELSIQLDPSVVFEYTSIQALAGWLCENHGVAVLKFFESVQQEQDPVDTAEDISEKEFNPDSFDHNEPKPDCEVKQRKSTEAIAVVGMACRFPGASNLDEYWNLLRSGKSAIVEVPNSRWGSQGKWVAGLIDGGQEFDPAFFKISEADARAMDPQARLLLEECANLLCNAGYTRSELQGANVGVYLGGRSRHWPEEDSLSKANNPIVAVGQNYLATNLSQYFDFRGPSMVVDTACSSALVGIQLAVQALKTGNISSAIVGGVNVLPSDAPHRLFAQRELLCDGKDFHLFDRRASGVVLGEGVGLVMLKKLDRAREDGDRVLAVIEGVAVNNDGRTVGPATPSIKAQKAVMEEALQQAGVLPEFIDHVEVNGSGSEVTDLIELKAIQSVYRGGEGRGYSLGSIKPNIGHPLCAEGIAGFIKLVLMLKNKQYVPFLSAQEPMVHFDMEQSPFRFEREAIDWNSEQRRASLNSFADGGTNAHVILRSVVEQTNSKLKGGRREIEPPEFRKLDFGPKVRTSAVNPWSMLLDVHHPMLKDHKVYGQELLPGLAYIDIVYQFFQDRGEAFESLELRGLTIYQPMTVGTERSVKLLIETSEPSDQLVKVEIFGRIYQGVKGKQIEGAKVLHATAEMHRVRGVAFDQRLYLRELEDVALEVQPISVAYSHYKNRELMHTGGMLAEGEIYITEKARTVNLKLPQVGMANAVSYLFHPTLIDASGVATGQMFDELLEGEDRLFLPLYFGKFRATGLMQKSCLTRVKQDSVRRKSDLLLMDLEFFDKEGKKLAELEEFTYKLVRDPHLITAIPNVSADEEITETPDENRSRWIIANSLEELGEVELSEGLSSTTKAELLVRQMFADQLQCDFDEVDADAGYFEMGMTSLGVVKLAQRIQEQVDSGFATPILFEYTTVSEIVAYLLKNYDEKLNALFVGKSEKEEETLKYSIHDFDVQGYQRKPSGSRKSILKILAHLLHRRIAMWVEGDMLKCRVFGDTLLQELRQLVIQNKYDFAQQLTVNKWIPLTRSQRRYWTLTRMQPGKAAYNNPLGISIRGDIAPQIIQKAALLMVNRHDTLRALCPRIGGQPAMVVSPLLQEFDYDFVQLDAEEESSERLREIATKESQTPINPMEGPNVRMKVIQLASDRHEVLFTVHHTVFDGFAYVPFLKEFAYFCRTLHAGDRLVPEKAIQYENYSLREPMEQDAKGIEFWKEQLSEAPTYTRLPLDRERPVLSQYSGKTQSIWIAPETYGKMEELALAIGVSFFPLMVGLLKLFIANWSGQKDIVFGTTVQCRDEVEDKNVLGDFTNFIALRSRIDLGQSLGDFVKRVHETSLDCLLHKNVPFEEIVRLSSGGSENVNPVYNILVNQLPPISELEGGLSDEALQISFSNNRVLNGAAMLDMRFEWYEEAQGLRLHCEYDTELFFESTVVKLLEDIQVFVEESMNSVESEVGQLIQFAKPTGAVSSESPVSLNTPVVSDRKNEGLETTGMNTYEEIEEYLLEQLDDLKDLGNLSDKKNMSFFELGLGSFDVANLSAELEEVYPDFEVGSVFKYPNISALVGYLHDRYGKVTNVRESKIKSISETNINFELFR